MRERTVWIALGVLLAGAVVVAVSSLRREEREIDVGLQGEARTNPLLAAERFLRQMGIPARSSGLSVLPGADHALLLTLPGHGLDVARRRRLLDWVRAGGHVVATATGPGTTWSDLAADPLLEACGVAGVPVDPARVDEADLGGIPSAFTRRGERKIAVAGEKRPLHVLVRTDVALQSRTDTSPRWLLDSDHRNPAAVTCPLGRGRVTVLADLIFTTNAELGERDHARLLWRLVTLDGTPAGVWLVREDHGPSLAGLVFGRGLPLVVALGLLGLAAAVRAGVRFGPPLPLPPRGRRSLLEHVEAVGALLWRTRRADVLLSASRTDLLARASRRRPALARLAPDARAAALARATGVPPRALREALEDPLPDTADAFVQAVHTLQDVRRKL
ncbi:MAG TPA: DUF4350 domain-containing protein [Candidatus Polarisedimenticolaceae bacterium]|nr:DUF4350 domain-containing protein [Candidatus Polarisedimenticolaceae bacterium]